MESPVKDRATIDIKSTVSVNKDTIGGPRGRVGNVAEFLV